MPKKIIQDGHPALRKKAALVPVKDITSPKIQQIIADMKAALKTQDDGVALAAAQIGLPLQIFVVSGAVLTRSEEKEYPDMVFINPTLLKLSQKKEWIEEGCLSVRPLYGKVLRSTKATIKAYDEKGQLVTRGASGLLAQVFQHETDHLNGVLFTDKARDVEAAALPNHDKD